MLGLKHALDADHLAAISAIVSERKSLLSSSLMGGLWGIGHTISLLAVGVVVILLQIRIPERISLALEFCVALMLIGLGINALYRIARSGRLHIHTHSHGKDQHTHLHLHADEHDTSSHSHHGSKFSWRPLIVGIVHGLAGSATLMLVVLTTISSSVVAFAYIIVFGFGSISGMILMSSLLSLPIQLTAQRFKIVHAAIRTLAGCFSLSFGLFMAYDIGFASGLLR